MKETIWKVDVSDEYLTFTRENRPNDFLDKAKKQPYGKLNGTYCGNRGFDDPVFKLHRKIKWKDEYYHKGVYNGARQWRLANGFAYAWEPSFYYKYRGSLYATHVNFV